MGCCGPSNKKSKEPQDRSYEKDLSPVDLLKIRLVRGEISFEEYEKTKAVLAE